MNFIYFLITYLINLFLFLAALGLRCCVQAFSSCGKWGLLFVAVRGLLICGGFSCCGARALGAWASVVVARGLSSCGSQALERRLRSCGSRALEHRLSSCGTWAQLLRGMWDLPGPGFEPVTPALAGGFLTTVPPGKPTTSTFSSLSPVFVYSWVQYCHHIITEFRSLKGTQRLSTYR